MYFPEKNSANYHLKGRLPDKMRYPLESVHVVPESSDTDGFDLDYYILEKEVRIEERNVKRFGIEIYKRGKRTNGTPYIEYRKIFDVFATAEEAAEMLRLMARNTVTPISMQYVLEDMLGVTTFTGEALFMEQAVS